MEFYWDEVREMMCGCVDVGICGFADVRMCGGLALGMGRRGVFSEIVGSLAKPSPKGRGRFLLKVVGGGIIVNMVAKNKIGCFKRQKFSCKP